MGIIRALVMNPKLVAVSIDSIRIGEPLPFPLMDAEGTLLANRGYVIESRAELQELVGRGVSLYINVADSEAYHRAYVGRLHEMVLKDTTLGQIADTQIGSAEVAVPSRPEPDEDDEIPDWLDYQVQATTLLRDPAAPLFFQRLIRLQRRLRQQALRNADGALFALFHLSASEIRMYSATHAMLVSVMCGLAAREVLNWPAEQEQVLCLAALTMNLGMTDLQDKLAQQLSPPTPEQRRLIDAHAERSVQLLQRVGVSDPAWLEAVRHHHSVPPGPLASRSEGLRMARLIQRADMFAARLAPRASRVPTSPAAAMQASYFDENRQVDEAGAALIKAVGIYSPGSFVRLQTHEIAVVIRRGANTTTPRVAVLINREGLPVVDPIIRDTSLREYRVVASVPHREVRIQLNLPRMLALTALPAA